MAYVSEGRASINISAMGDNTIIAADSNSTIYIYSLVIYANDVTNVVLKDGTDAINGDGFDFLANTGFDKDFPKDRPLRLTKGNAFVIELSAAVGVTGWVEYDQR